jgi:hypothetical protein
MVVGDLSLETTKGGNLGVYIDVLPNRGVVTPTVAWNAPPLAEPTSFTATAGVSGFPGAGDYSVRWTVYDPTTNAVKYQSPTPETSLSHTFNASLATGHLDDLCTGERTDSVKVKAEVSRNNVTNSGPATSTSTEWYTQPNQHACQTDSDNRPK